MDANILKILISNSVTPANIEISNELQSSTNEVEFPAIRNNIIDKLSKSMTKYLSYKISKEAYQRYSVRLNIIETLRDWSRIKGDLRNLTVFQDSEQVYNFLIRLLKKYLTQDVIDSCDSVNNLVDLGELLLILIPLYKSFTKYFSRVIEKIVLLDQNEESLKFLQRVINISNDLKLDLAIAETIYIGQKSYFIEKPLTNSFIAYCSNQSEDSQLCKMKSLFEKVVDSPPLFQTLSFQLKELFVTTNYAKLTQNFIQNVLNEVQTNCSKYNKDILDLYPANLQSCVILLRIKPSYHTEKSKHHTIELLKNILSRNCDEVLILVSHFPDWLPEYLLFFENIEEFTQKSESIPSSINDC